MYRSVKKLFTLAAALLVAVAPVASADEAPDVRVFAKGNAAALRSYIGAPVLLVSAYKAELIRTRGTVDAQGRRFSMHRYIVLQSTMDDFSIGSAIFHKQVHKGKVEITDPKGKLYYMINPTKKSTKDLANEWELNPGFILIPAETRDMDVYNDLRKKFKGK